MMSERVTLAVASLAIVSKTLSSSTCTLKMKMSWSSGRTSAARLIACQTQEVGSSSFICMSASIPPSLRYLLHPACSGHFTDHAIVWRKHTGKSQSKYIRLSFYSESNHVEKTQANISQNHPDLQELIGVSISST